MLLSLFTICRFRLSFEYSITFNSLKKLQTKKKQEIMNLLTKRLNTLKLFWPLLGQREITLIIFI